MTSGQRFVSFLLDFFANTNKIFVPELANTEIQFNAFIFFISISYKLIAIIMNPQTCFVFCPGQESSGGPCGAGRTFPCFFNVYCFIVLPCLLNCLTNQICLNDRRHNRLTNNICSNPKCR